MTGRALKWLGFGFLVGGALLLNGHPWRDWLPWLFGYWAGVAMQMGRNKQ